MGADVNMESYPLPDFAPLHTAASSRCPARQRMTDKFAPAFLRTAGRQQRGYVQVYFPAAASLLFTLRVMLAFSKQSKLMNLAQPNSVFRQQQVCCSRFA